MCLQHLLNDLSPYCCHKSKILDGYITQTIFSDIVISIITIRRFYDRTHALSLKQNGDSYTDNTESSYRTSTPQYCTQCKNSDGRTILVFEFIKDTPPHTSIIVTGEIRLYTVNNLGNCPYLNGISSFSSLPTLLKISLIINCIHTAHGFIFLVRSGEIK